MDAALEEAQRLYDRRRLLEMEKRLARIHQELDGIRRELELTGPQELADSANTALWGVTALSMQVTLQQGLRTP